MSLSNVSLTAKKENHRKIIRNIQLNTVFQKQRASFAQQHMSMSRNSTSTLKMDIQPNLLESNSNSRNPNDIVNQLNYIAHQQNSYRKLINKPNSPNTNNQFFLPSNQNLNQFNFNSPNEQIYYENIWQPMGINYGNNTNNKNFKNILSNQKILDKWYPLGVQKHGKNNINEQKAYNKVYEPVFPAFQKSQKKDYSANHEQLLYSPQILSRKNKSPINQREDFNYLQKNIFNKQKCFANQHNKCTEQQPKQSLYKRKNNVKIFNKLLGKGTFANVYQGYHESLNIKVAVKEIKKSQIGASQSQIQCLSKINHQNIIKLYDTFEDGDFVYIVLELATDNLRVYLQKLKKYASTQSAINQKKMKLAKMLIIGMDYLYKNGIIHRDLKLQNVLIKDQILKICDFGLARNLDHNLQLQSIKCGTPYTMAPQIYYHTSLSKPIYTFKSDIFSLGVILHQMFYQNHPFSYDANKMKSLSRIYISRKFEWIDQIIDGALVDVKKRLCWEQIIKIFNFSLNNRIQKSVKKSYKNVDNSLKKDKCEERLKQNIIKKDIFRIDQQASQKFDRIKQKQQIQNIRKLQKYEKQIILNIKKKSKNNREMQIQQKQQQFDRNDTSVEQKQQVKVKKVPLKSNAIVKGYKKITQKCEVSKKKQKIMRQDYQNQCQNITNQNLANKMKDEKQIYLSENKGQQHTLNPCLYQAIMLIIILMTIWCIFSIKI